MPSLTEEETALVLRALKAYSLYHSVPNGTAPEAKPWLTTRQATVEALIEKIKGE